MRIPLMVFLSITVTVALFLVMQMITSGSILLSVFKALIAGIITATPITLIVVAIRWANQKSNS